MKQDKAMELVVALRSGKYKQGRNRLKHPGQDSSGDSYCCLGVACLVAGETFNTGGQCNAHDGIMPPSVRDYFGFADQNGAVGTAPLWKKLWALTSVNDDRDSSFELVADLIEKRWMDL